LWRVIRKSCATRLVKSISGVVNMKLRFANVGNKISAVFNGLLLLTALVLAVVLFPEKESALPENLNILSGNASVSDGDSLRFGRERVRLIGMDAPELDQTCTYANGQSWPCGEAARQRLVSLLADGELECTFEKRDRYDRALAVCRVDGVDIGAILVSEGLAVSYNDYGGQEAGARAQKIGMWAGDFITPRNWRQGQR